MTHLPDMLAGCLANRVDGMSVGFRQVFEGAAGIGIIGHAVEQLDPQLAHAAGHLWDMFLVDTGNNDAVDFDEDVAGFQPTDGLQLTFQQDRGGFGGPQDALADAHPGVNLGADLRVHGIDGDRHVAHLQFGQFIQIRRQIQAVGGDTEHHLRAALAHEAAGFQGLGRIGKRITRPGDAHHADMGLLAQHLLKVNHGLGRREDGAGNAGSTLVDTIELTVAELALDIAARRHRQMHPAETAMGLAIETGMIVDIHGSIFLLCSFR